MTATIAFIVVFIVAFIVAFIITSNITSTTTSLGFPLLTASSPFFLLRITSSLPFPLLSSLPFQPTTCGYFALSRCEKVLGVEAKVIFNEGGDEVIRMIVPFLDPKFQGICDGLGRLFKRLRTQLVHGTYEETIR